MDRRDWLRAAALTGMGVALNPAETAFAAPAVHTRRVGAPTLVLRGGAVFDGSGGAPTTGDIAVTGDRITAKIHIQNIEEKSGRSGRFVLITRETLYTNQDGDVVARGRFSVIAR